MLNLNEKREVKRARLFEFADFLDKLPKEKFNHSKWCVPDHTCKTQACLAGWATLQYTKEGKEFINTTFAVQKFMESNNMDGHWDSHGLNPDELKEYERLHREQENAYLQNEDWSELGQHSLGIGPATATILFYPSSGFWSKAGIRRASNKQAALTIRYLASTKDLRIRDREIFNEDRMNKKIQSYQANSSN